MKMADAVWCADIRVAIGRDRRTTVVKAPETRRSPVDPRFEKDLPKAQEQSLPTRRFAAIAAEQDATYPMLAPAASLHVGADEDVYDEQILAGLVNV
jgi:hypothetical protein